MRGTLVMVGLLALILFCLEGAMSQELAGGPGARGMSYTIDDILEGVLPDLDQIAADWKAMGGTSIQTYVTWETCERAGDGQWDWSKWDQTAATLQRHGLKWIPFLILGPAYSTPDWFREGEEHVGCVCLEHGITSKIESLWNPFLKARVDRFLATFAERYAATGILESVNLGIQGDFGEAIYSVAGTWTKNVPGEYHNHAGFWCGDEYALADFRDWARRKYGALSLLNQAWGTQYESFETVDYPARGEDLPQVNVGVLKATPQERRRWLDFVTWYREAMTDLSDWWLADARKHFPNTQIYLCTGGDAHPTMARSSPTSAGSRQRTGRECASLTRGRTSPATLCTPGGWPRRGAIMARISASSRRRLRTNWAPSRASSMRPPRAPCSLRTSITTR